VHPQRPTLLFDLDGTLTDSKPGILGCLKTVFDARRISDPGPLDRFIGPPVETWVAELLPNARADERLELANEYRACYNREGWKNNSVYSGVREMLTALQKHEFPLYVCTSKRQDFAIRILNHFDLTSFFKAIYGDQPEFASHGKAELLRSLLNEHHIDSRHVWMIGDRIFDIDAARANGIGCIFVAWGYGPVEEGTHADAVAEHPSEVTELLLRQESQLAAAGNA
jgi:phosphoglycolate phosphatase